MAVRGSRRYVDTLASRFDMGEIRSWVELGRQILRQISRNEKMEDSRLSAENMNNTKTRYSPGKVEMN